MNGHGSEYNTKGKTPIIFIHFGNQEHLYIAIKQAKKYNPDSRIILIGDESNKNCVDFIEHYMINDFISQQREELKKIYIHLSTNNYEIERFCIERWFVLNEFCKRNPEISNFLTIDSDIMLYCDVDAEAEKFKKFDFTLSGSSGDTCYFNNLEVLQGFLDYILDIYKNPKTISLLKGTNRLSGQVISDMTLIMSYAFYIGLERVGFINLPIENSVYNHNFTFSGKQIRFKLQKDILYRIDKKAKEKIRCNSLHFQWQAKMFMKKVYKTGKIPNPNKTVLNRIQNELYRFVKKNYHKIKNKGK